MIDIILLGILNAGVACAWFLMLREGMIFHFIYLWALRNNVGMFRNYLFKITVGCPYCFVVYLNLATDPFNVIYLTGISYLVIAWHQYQLQDWNDSSES
jgi:hypothetical protein